MRAHAYLPVVFLALAACATSPTVLATAEAPAAPTSLFPPTRPPADPALVARVEEIRGEAGRLLEAQAEALWRVWTEGTAVGLAGGLAGSEELFTAETVRTVRRVREGTADPGKRRALLFLETYLAGEYVARAAAPETARIVAHLRTSAVASGGISFPFAELDARLAVEPDREQRAALEAAAVPVLRALEPLRLAEEAKIEEAVRTLGYRGYAELGAAVRQLDLGPTAQLARRFLDATREPYRRALTEAARRELGLAPAEVRRADVPRLWRGIGFDAGFPRARSLSALDQTLAGLGLGLRDGSVRIDDAERPTKAARPLCVPVRIPGDVRLSVRPAAGVAEWAALLHEAGHAQHFAHAANGAFELDLLGNHATGDALARIFEDLLEEPAWLEAHTDLGGPERAAFRASEATKKLYLLRRYAARTLFELSWRTGQLGGVSPREAWRRALEEAVGFPLSDDDALRWALEGEDFFAAADHLRAFVLAAMIEERLAKSHGERWWTEPAAGVFLRELWAGGNRDRPLELARLLGVPALDEGPLVRRLVRGLDRPAPTAPVPP